MTWVRERTRREVPGKFKIQSSLKFSMMAALVFPLAFFSLGCKPPPEPRATHDVEHQLLSISAAYFQAGANLRRPPNSLEDITPYLKDGQRTPAEILKSPTDGEDFVIVWGVDFVKLAAAGQNSRVVIAYEKTGKAGIRNVLLAPSQVKVMSQSEFLQAPFPPGHQPKT